MNNDDVRTPKTVPPDQMLTASSPSTGTAPGTPVEHGRFVPGAMFGKRYRIVGLLGRGGMGEVYRADDLELGQSVALKFLPRELADSPAALTRFRNEVRVARQVSHPNVCRVYDIGEVHGQYFLSMEYVDGQDLSADLRRMGRPSKDKAIQIARQLCAGLAAAHENGVLHRDLKPANVMIDGRGNVRITDFGLAALIKELRGAEVRAGTPAYMAPEQLQGKEVSIRSDVYSLGLLLHEVFTGKRAFDDRGTPALQDRIQGDITPTTPSSIVDDIDPAVERVILRCFEHDPRQRPSSALAVAAALPDGDLLAAALAAGETPSPDLVAAAGEVGGLQPSLAWCLLAGLVGVLVVGVFVAHRASAYQRAALEKPPQALADIAGNLVRELGYTAPPRDTARGFIYEQDYRRYLREQAPAPEELHNLAADKPSPIAFWYRQSPHLLTAQIPLDIASGWTRGAVTLTDPPSSLSGMVTVCLDPRGRLLEFRVVPPQASALREPNEPPDWATLFTAAGLDPERFTPVASTWTPPVYGDTRAAWERTRLQAPEVPIRVEAAAYAGKPVYFQLIRPWTKPQRDEPFEEHLGTQVAANIGSIIWYVVLIGAAVLAIRNLRLGRADRRGAFKLGVFVFSLTMLVWLFNASHVPDLEHEQLMLMVGLGAALQSAVRYWLYYLALEPYVRKLWPQSLISWTRVLAGRFRDPLVGRDLLVGALFGVSWWLLQGAGELLASSLGAPPAQPFVPMWTDTLLGARYVGAQFVEYGVIAIFMGLMLLMLFLLLRIVLRRQWPAIAVFVAICSAPFVLATDHYVFWLVGGLMFASLIFLLLRFGLFALIAGFFSMLVLAGFPVTLDFSAWYIGASLFAMAAVTALALYGFYVSLAGRPLFTDQILAAKEARAGST